MFGTCMATYLLNIMAIFNEVHEAAEPGVRHPPHNWKFDNAILREAASIPPTLENLKNIALQLDDNSQWMLLDSVEDVENPGTYITTWKNTAEIDLGIDLVAIYNLSK